MSLLKSIAKIPLDFLSFCLKKSPAALYYLVNEGLRNEIKSTSERAFAYQHIENAIKIAQKLTTSKGIILDVGGGTATTANIFSKHFPDTPIYVFEPISANFQEISKQKQKNWQLINKAVGSEIGISHINIANRITASSLLEMNQNTEGYGNMLESKGVEKIEITTLDSEIPPSTNVLILKMDVQGFELEVLKGAERTLKNTQVIVLEINNHDGYKGSPTYFEIDDLLRSKNFTLQDILPSKRINNKLQDWDAIYVKKNI